MKAAHRSLSLLASALLGFGLATGDPLQICPSNAGGVCYSIAVPTSSADAGSGNIYFQIEAPTSFQWVALGTGSVMAGSNIFLMYQDGNGNLTLSPRLGPMYSMPELDTSSTAARLTLLAGSGVSVDGATMTANVACSNCQAWNGGAMSLTSTSAAWIAAWRKGPSLATTDRAASIDQHDDHAQFSVDLTRATISSDSNPFTSNRNTGGGSGGGGSGSGSGSGSSPGGGIIQRPDPSKSGILAAHGIIMAIVMAVLYPLGSVLMPLVGKWWLHGAWQAIAFCLMWAGFGLGVQTAQDLDLLFRERHTIFGTVVVCLLAIQPALGFAHHRHYLKMKSRGVVSYVHIWWGRIMMVLGVINGGFGLQLAGERDSLVIAYSVVAGVILLSYFLYKLCKGCAAVRRRAAADGSGDKDASMPVPGRPYQESRRRGTGYV
ncbi:hypothetical protein VTK56DRAFT_3371 [Thermocarpiscus australiensis]